jgi:hypothetical protein
MLSYIMIIILWIKSNHDPDKTGGTKEMKGKLILLLSLGMLLSACNTPARVETLPPPSIEMAEVTIYFLDESRFANGNEPYEVGVIREIHPDAFLPRLALQAYFDGPTEEEKAQGLAQVLSGCTGFSEFYIDGGVAHVTLTGPCDSGGSTYTIAQPIMNILRQFNEIEFIKLYDAEGITEEPIGRSNSIPFVLEP